MSAMPSNRCAMTWMGKSASSADSSRSLFALELAKTRRTAMPDAVSAIACGELRRMQLRDACRRKIQQFVELVTPECVSLRRPLYFDEGSAAVHDHVHVRFGVGIFGIVE